MLARWRSRVRELPSARDLDVPTLNDHLPGLLAELVKALRLPSDQTIPESLGEGTATAHGLQRLHEAFDIQEVVAEYDVFRGCIHDLADERRLTLQGRPFHILNRVFDQAIGFALQAYAENQAAEVTRRREEYLAFVAHDLKTPLSAIALASHVLEQTLPPSSPNDGIGQILSVLRRSTLQLDALVRKVLEENASVQSDSGVKLVRREFELWPFVEALVYDVRPLAASSQTTLANHVPDDLVVFADAGLLRRILQNLITNAVTYSPAGKVTIAAQVLSESGDIEASVSDTGAGIPEALLEKIFEKGETDPNKEGGTGLGLAIVKTFIEAHGGSVTVESQEGAGSTFRLRLPRRPQKCA